MSLEVYFVPRMEASHLRLLVVIYYSLPFYLAFGEQFRLYWDVLRSAEFAVCDPSGVHSTRFQLNYVA